jgi:thiol-disulfide isomerase/thioredoxin
MSGLLFLTSEDFVIGRGSKGPILCTNITNGISLVLFYSTQCTFCHTLIPIFKTLPGTLPGCQFGMINISQNRKVIQLAKDTIAPIEYVPYILLYINGKPYMKYNGPYDINEIRRFVVEVAKSVQKNQKFSSTNVVQNKKSIPSYSIGVPLYGREDVCYLDFDNAYVKGQK